MGGGVIGVIPARWNSVRFPGKPLALILGRPMLQHVYERASSCLLISELLIATDDDRITEAAKGFGARVVMTSAEHPTGTDRVAEAISQVDGSVVVNIQGDEPLLRPKSIDRLVSEMASSSAVEMATLACKVVDTAELESKSCAKVVLDSNNEAIYFSRSKIPYVMGSHPVEFYKHVGVYGYRRDVLDRLAASAPTPLEVAEGLEQLRALEQGVRIRVVKVNEWGPAVDTPQDIERVEEVLQKERPNR